MVSVEILLVRRGSRHLEKMTDAEMNAGRMGAETSAEMTAEVTVEMKGEMSEEMIAETSAGMNAETSGLQEKIEMSVEKTEEKIVEMIAERTAEKTTGGMMIEETTIDENGIEAQASKCLYRQRMVSFKGKSRKNEKERLDGEMKKGRWLCP
jgi:hypothetical protein